MSRSPQNYSAESDLTATFENLGGKLDHPATIFLLGGGAMTLRGTKPGTKDIDVMAPSEREYRRVRAALIDLGYEPKEHVAPEYASIGATSVLVFGEDKHIDLFDRQVAQKLRFTDGMESRATQIFSHGNVTVYAFSPTDIALFKAVTPRPRDLDDVRTIIAAHLGTDFDWDVLAGELEDQLPLNYGVDEYEWIVNDKPHPFLQLERTIRDLDGVPSELETRVKRLADVVEAEGYVVLELRERGEVDREPLIDIVTENHPTAVSHVERAFERLHGKELVDGDGSTLKLLLE